MYVSELALGSRGWIQNANFIVFGLLFLIFTRSVAGEFQTGKASRGGILLLSIIALCYLSFGFFVMDPLSTARNELTFSGIFHALLGEVVLVLMPVSCFVFLRRFHEDGNWRFLHWWTIVIGTIIAIAGSLMIVSLNLPSLQKVLHEWLGHIQRFSIVPYMMWLFIFALGILRQSKCRVQ
jgi:heme/copper-type cytochrome/quinol oxidase subunit 4